LKLHVIWWSILHWYFGDMLESQKVVLDE
jgi:hypothetical protein